jgi:hypothetical protein
MGGSVGPRRAAAAASAPAAVLVFAVILLFANALFNAIAWPRFYPRIAADPRAP